MKRKYIAIMIAALLVSSVTACKTESGSSSQDSSSPVQDVPSTENASSDAESENPTSQPSGSDSSADTEENDSAQQNEASADEQLLLEQNGIKVYALVSDLAQQATLGIRAENTSDQNYIIQLADVSVNNFVMHPAFSLNVDANSVNDMSAAFSPEDLEACGIQTVSHMDAKVLLLDALSFETLYTSEPVTIKTGESETSSYDETGEVVYDKDGLKLVSKGIVDDPISGKSWKVYISNDTDQDLALEASNIIVGDATLDVILSLTVPKGKKAIGTMSIFQEDLDKYLITDIHSLETTLKILDPETFELRQTIDDISLTFPS
ncbi:MAG: hypothetical protein KH828_03750 [Clostridiales bacterium]|nr:hypothetical protein [Clostridiales bacterium]